MMWLRERERERVNADFLIFPSSRLCSHWLASGSRDILSCRSSTSTSSEIGLFVLILGDLLSPNHIHSFTCWHFPSHLLHRSIIDRLDCRLVHLLRIIAWLNHIRHLVDRPSGFSGGVAGAAWRSIVPVHDFASLLVVLEVLLLPLDRSLRLLIFKWHYALFWDLALDDLEYLVGGAPRELTCTAVAPIILSFLWSVVQLKRLDHVLLELFPRLLLLTWIFVWSFTSGWPHQVKRIIQVLGWVELLDYQFCLHHDDIIFFYFN